MNVLQRMAQPTPKFFQALRNIGLVLTALGGAVIGAHATLPAVVTNVAGYVALAGGVITTVSQTAVTNEQE